jgi:YHS domain-containing protein
MKKLDAIAAYVCALIFLQTLFFKFTGAPESIYIFKTLGVEPWGRYLSGVVELISAILLIPKATRVYGALLGAGTMAGALMSHLLFLGVVVQDDGGLLFALCLTALVAASFIIFYRRKELPLHIVGLALLTILPLGAQAKVSYNTESDFGIHGYDPVAYLTSKQALEGKKEIRQNFEGLTYLFATEENKDLFSKEPQKFIPAYGGWCAYAMAEGEKVDIDPKTFKIVDGKTYLFYNGVWGNTLKKWDKEEPKLKMNADKEWVKLIK